MPTETARVPTPIATEQRRVGGLRRGPELSLALAPSDPRRVGAGLPHRRADRGAPAGRPQRALPLPLPRGGARLRPRRHRDAPPRRSDPPHGAGRLRLSSRPASGRVTASSTSPTSTARCVVIGQQRSERRHRLSRVRQGENPRPRRGRHPRSRRPPRLLGRRGHRACPRIARRRPVPRCRAAADAEAADPGRLDRLERRRARARVAASAAARDTSPVPRWGQTTPSAC